MNPELENLQFEKVYRAFIAKMISQLYYGENPPKIVIDTIADDKVICDLLKSILPCSTEIKTDYIAISKMTDDDGMCPWEMPIRCCAYLVHKLTSDEISVFIKSLNAHVMTLDIPKSDYQLPKITNSLTRCTKDFYMYLFEKKKTQGETQLSLYYLVRYRKYYWRKMCEIIFSCYFPKAIYMKPTIIDKLLHCDELCEFFYNHCFYNIKRLFNILMYQTLDDIIKILEVNSALKLMYQNEVVEETIRLRCMTIFDELGVYQFSEFQAYTINTPERMKNIADGGENDIVNEWMNNGGREYMKRDSGPEPS